MAVAFNPNKRREFTLKDEEHWSTPTVFVLREDLTAGDRLELAGIAQSLRDRPESTSVIAYEYVRRALVGWRQFNDESSNPVPFEFDAYGKASRETLDRLDLKTLMELFNEVVKKATPNVTEVGKS